MQLRLFRILWGPTLETVLDFVTPVAGDSPRIWRQPRAESERLDAGTTSDALITGRDYYLSVVAKWFDLAHQTGPTGLQAFIDWANDGNAFTLVPSTDIPTLTVPGCFLNAPILDPSWSAENDATMTVELVIRHPTQDLGLAWRGLFFEYVAGQSLTDPVAATFARSTVGYEVTPGGYLLSHVADNVCDGHYADRVSGLQTTLIENAVTNDVTNPEDLSNASWDKTTNVTVTANNAKAPDQAITADLVLATVTNATHTIKSNAFTIVAGDVLTGIAFVRDGGLNQGRVRFVNGADNFNIIFNLTTGVISGTAEGAGAVIAVRSVPLAGGWTMLWLRGTVNGTSTSVQVEMVLRNSGGAETFAGDAASGIYLWGVTAVHGAAKCLASYTPTTSASDKLSYAYAPVPQATWWYMRFIEWDGALGGSNFPRLLELASSEFAIPGWLINPNTPNYSVTLHLAGGSVSVTRPAGVPGDIIEQLFLIYSDASIELRQSINGAAETTSGRSATVPGGLPATWSAPTKLGIGDNPNTNGGRASSTLMNTIRHGPLVLTGAAAVTTLAAARDK